MLDVERTAFGLRLVLARRKAKLTQKQAASAVGMSQSALAEAEATGQGSAFTSQLALLYQVDPVELASGITSKSPHQPKHYFLPLKEDVVTPTSRPINPRLLELIAEMTDDEQMILAVDLIRRKDPPAVELAPKVEAAA